MQKGCFAQENCVFVRTITCGCVGISVLIISLAGVSFQPVGICRGVATTIEALALDGDGQLRHQLALALNILPAGTAQQCRL
jgi:hypothetical protein